MFDKKWCIFPVSHWLQYWLNIVERGLASPKESEHLKVTKNEKTNDAKLNNCQNYCQEQCMLEHNNIHFSHLKSHCICEEAQLKVIYHTFEYWLYNWWGLRCQKNFLHMFTEMTTLCNGIPSLVPNYMYSMLQGATKEIKETHQKF